MSEPSALAMRVSIDSDRRDAFLSSKAAGLLDYDDWGTWLEPLYPQSVDWRAQAGPAVSCSVGEVLAAFDRPPSTCVVSSYRPDTRVWNLLLTDCGASPLDIASLASILRSVSGYVAADDGRIAVVAWIYDSPELGVAIHRGRSELVSLSTVWREEAVEALYSISPAQATTGGSDS